MVERPRMSGERSGLQKKEAAVDMVGKALTAGFQNHTLPQWLKGFGKPNLRAEKRGVNFVLQTTDVGYIYVSAYGEARKTKRNRSKEKIIKLRKIECTHRLQNHLKRF